MPILKASEVVDDRHNAATRGAAVLHTAQAAADHLHVAYGAENLPCDEYHVRLRRIEAGGEHAVVAQYSDIFALEAIDEVAARYDGRAAAHSGGGDAREIEAGSHFLSVLHGVAKEKNGSLGRLPDVFDKALVPLLVTGESLVNGHEQFLEVEALPRLGKPGQSVDLVSRKGRPGMEGLIDGLCKNTL